jgi:hypothetical protein
MRCPFAVVGLTVAISAFAASCGEVDGSAGSDDSCGVATEALQYRYDDGDWKNTDVGSGFFFCEDGSAYRVEAVACVAPPSGFHACEAHDDAGAPDGECSIDADCGGGDLCIARGEWCECVTPCQSDADCGEGQACLCPMHIGASGINLLQTCRPADCATDADCGDHRCGLSDPLCGPLSVHCRTDQDSCEACPAICIFDELAES